MKPYPRCFPCFLICCCTLYSTLPTPIGFFVEEFIIPSGICIRHHEASEGEISKIIFSNCHNGYDSLSVIRTFRKRLLKNWWWWWNHHDPHPSAVVMFHLLFDYASSCQCHCICRLWRQQVWLIYSLNCVFYLRNLHSKLEIHRLNKSHIYC